MKYLLPLVAICIAVGSMVYSNNKINAQQEAFNKQLANLKSSLVLEEEEEEHEMAEYMRALQWNINKLYFSGINENEELVEFYVHELEEVMEEVAHAGIMDDNIPVSKHMKTYGLNGIEQFEKEMITEFGAAYSNLMNSCNSCHLATEHGYIKIKVPENPISDNQVF